MNNGKVRIYELSKELNLDNKDILAVCEQLNISVKSHSSTITEPEAELIRKTAESLPHSPSRSAVPEKSNSQNQESTFNHNEGKKQQILEIRKPRPKPLEERAKLKNQTQTHNNNVQLVATPPKPPAPEALDRQIQPLSKPRPNLSLKLEGEKGKSVSAVDKKSTDIAPDRSLEKTVTEVPQLVRPPVRPAPPSINRNLQSPSITKPNQKNKKTKQEGKKRKDREEKPSQKPAIVNKKENKDTSQKESVRPPILSPETSSQSKQKHRDRPTVKPKQVQELQKPQLAPKPRLKISVDSPKDTDIDLDITEEKEPEEKVIELDYNNEVEKPRRKIISPSKPPSAKLKKGPTWEEEEEDSSEIAQKNAKASAKAKRLRPKPLLEEDDEDLEELLNKPEPVTMSLSLARPPKPNSSPGKTKSNSGNNAPSIKKKSSKSQQPVKSEIAEQNQSVEAQPLEKLVINSSMTVQELATALAVSETEIIKRLFMKGIAVNITESLDIATIEMVAEEEGIPVEALEEESAAKKTTEMLEDADLEKLERRPPVVTIMGHVDHGKTSLLDSIRATKVAAGEAGGITQHIGAYHVDVEHEGKMQQVVFLDTPGHEAFTAMRARGTRVTDVAVLVVAADDGVQPQTIEAISHAKAAGVPLIVAINKVDKEEANPDRVKQELMEHGLVPEEWGGDAIMVPVSAIKKQNLDSLLEMILLVSEVEDLQANPERLAKGTIIEAHLDKARGPVASLLVQNGTLRVGDIVVAGSVYGKVRAMIDDRGDRVEKASPSFAVEVLGLRDVPQAGDEFDVFENEKDASSIATDRADAQRESRIMRRTTLGAVSARAQAGDLKELNLILKADVQGSVEAIVAALRQLPQKEVQLRLLFSGAGEVTETDIDLAAASEAVIIGFNTTMASGARQAADAAGVDVREYNVIYKLLDDVQGAMEGLLDPELVEEPLGEVEVRAVFTINRGAVAGCYVLSGKVIRNCKVRIRRKGEVIHQGVLDSLRRIKDDVKEVNAGYECGISLDNFSDWAEGDIVEGYQMVTKRRKLSI
ncbi:MULTISPECIES: translation initiation factor IF-2 [unclassified Okeania]|uniref:translation initiation factor IF-2 n=1 Tax=unclassified Okeania TaxID=2634635 RepID=UPI0013BBDE25|nr:MULTISPECIES: translation initiation factor IF-2 [unclassified Okeania]NES74698.1 translation initiation factor IF-2 [Okeania sp. SIO1H4]NET18420.1 translation initiation factor IF-2 [Okeania sp. SIO1H5]NET96860.1 translation initiation factor IF-2 [Okeania sp. SIO1H2]